MAWGNFPLFTFGLKHEPDWVWIEIGDNGTGMKEEQQKRIVEPFFTTKNPYEGMGLWWGGALRILFYRNGKPQGRVNGGIGAGHKENTVHHYTAETTKNLICSHPRKRPEEEWLPASRGRVLIGFRSSRSAFPASP